MMDRRHAELPVQARGRGASWSTGPSSIERPIKQLSRLGIRILQLPHRSE